jgi:hypothetical protein
MRVATIALTTAIATTTTGLIPLPALAIEQGTSITTAPPWAAYVTVVGKYVRQILESYCTGTVVSDGWVLTAAHCVVQEDKSGAPTTTPLPGRAFAIVLGRSDLNKTNQGRQFSVDQVKVDPNYSPGTGANDAALVHLVGALPATARPLPLAPGGYVIPDGQDVTAYGYGHTFEYYKTASSDEKPTAANTLNVTVAGSYTKESGCESSSYPTDWCFSHDGTSQVLHGDSGGPWVTDIANKFVVGITSQLRCPCTYNASQHTYEYRYHEATRITLPPIHDWVTATANVLGGSTGDIYRNPATGASWLMEQDGFLHPIADGGTYLCLTGNGASVHNLSDFQRAELPVTAGDATCVNRGNVLIYGDGDFGEDSTGFSNLQSALEASGFTVTALPGQTQLPSDISGYAEIWHYGIDVPSESDQQTLISFAKSGRGVFLTGERPCCETENGADATIINSLIVSVGGIGVGGLGDIGSCSDNETINQTAVGNVATYPNALTTWHPECPGGLSNVTASNAFARGPDGTPVAAVWGSGDVIGGGKLAILMDVNWAQNSYKDASTMSDVAQNIAAFLH